MTENFFQIVGNLCLNQWQENEKEICAIDYHSPDSNFDSTWLEIEAVIPCPRIT